MKISFAWLFLRVFRTSIHSDPTVFTLFIIVEGFSKVLISMTQVVAQGLQVGSNPTKAKLRTKVLRLLGCRRREEGQRVEEPAEEVTVKKLVVKIEDAAEYIMDLKNTCVKMSVEKIYLESEKVKPTETTEACQPPSPRPMSLRTVLETFMDRSNDDCIMDISLDETSSWTPGLLSR